MPSRAQKSPAEIPSRPNFPNPTDRVGQVLRFAEKPFRVNDFALKSLGTLKVGQDFLLSFASNPDTITTAIITMIMIMLDARAESFLAF